MSLTKIIHKRASIIPPVLFSLFFTCTVLSPSLGGPTSQGQTLYLYWFVPLFDCAFIKETVQAIRLFRKDAKGLVEKYKGAYLFAAGLVIWMSLVGNYTLLLKCFSIAYAVLYLRYMKKHGYIQLIYLFVNINIGIALIQFVAYYINVDSLNILGPSGIATMLWGNKAAMTFTNPEGMLFETFGIIRVSGLSREAGFFTSLIVATALAYFLEVTVSKKRISAAQVVFFMVGLFLSLSRMSFISAALTGVIILRKRIAKIGFAPTFAIWLIVVLLLAIGTSSLGYSDAFQTENGIIMRNESLGQRFGSPIALLDLSCKEAFFGCNGVNNISNQSIFTQYLVSRNFPLCGISEIVVQIGVIGLLLYLGLLKKAFIGPVGLLIIMLSTISVDPLSAASFVSLTYWIVIQYNNELNCSCIRS